MCHFNLFEIFRFKTCFSLGLHANGSAPVCLNYINKQDKSETNYCWRLKECKSIIKSVCSNSVLFNMCGFEDYSTEGQKILIKTHILSSFKKISLSGCFFWFEFRFNRLLWIFKLYHLMLSHFYQTRHLFVINCNFRITFTTVPPAYSISHTFQRSKIISLVCRRIKS